MSVAMAKKLEMMEVWWWRKMMKTPVASRKNKQSSFGDCGREERTNISERKTAEVLWVGNEKRRDRKLDPN